MLARDDSWPRSRLRCCWSPAPPAPSSWGRRRRPPRRAGGRRVLQLLAAPRRCRRTSPARARHPRGALQHRGRADAVPDHAGALPLHRPARPPGRQRDLGGPPAAAGPGTGKLVSYQSFYDSLDPADGPSRGVAGAPASSGGAIVTGESGRCSRCSPPGYTVNFPDTEGQDADFAAGPEYGRLTLDSIRAASVAEGTGLAADTPVGMLGYSGGAIATGWAAALAPTYAPDVNARLVGATEGGVLVAPARNLRYIDGTPLWGGVEGMALIGVARAFDIDFTPYLSDYGRQVFAEMQDAAIGEVLGQYPDFRFARLVKPEYADPSSIKEFVDASNALNLGRAPTPDRADADPPGRRRRGRGHARRQAGHRARRRRDDRGRRARAGPAVLRGRHPPSTTPQYDALSHTPGAVPWLPGAVAFLAARFAGPPAHEHLRLHRARQLAGARGLPGAGDVRRRGRPDHPGRRPGPHPHPGAAAAGLAGPGRGVGTARRRRGHGRARTVGRRPRRARRRAARRPATAHACGVPVTTRSGPPGRRGHGAAAPVAVPRHAPVKVRLPPRQSPRRTPARPRARRVLTWCAGAPAAAETPGHPGSGHGRRGGGGVAGGAVADVERSAGLDVVPVGHHHLVPHGDEVAHEARAGRRCRRRPRRRRAAASWSRRAGRCGWPGRPPAPLSRSSRVNDVPASSTLVHS